MVFRHPRYQTATKGAGWNGWRLFVVCGGRAAVSRSCSGHARLWHGHRTASIPVTRWRSLGVEVEWADCDWSTCRRAATKLAVLGGVASDIGPVGIEGRLEELMV